MRADARAPAVLALRSAAPVRADAALSHFFCAARGLGASALGLFALPSAPSVAAPPSLPAPSSAPRHSRHLPRSFPCPHLMPPPPPPAGALDAPLLLAAGLWAARGAVRSTCARGGGRSTVRSTCARGGARGGTRGACCGCGGWLISRPVGWARQSAGWRTQCARLGRVRAECSAGRECLCATGQHDTVKDLLLLFLSLVPPAVLLSRY